MAAPFCMSSDALLQKQMRKKTNLKVTVHNNNEGRGQQSYLREISPGVVVLVCLDIASVRNDMSVRHDFITLDY